MPKKKQAVSASNGKSEISRREVGKKQKRSKKNDLQKNDEKSILEFGSKQSAERNHIKRKISLFFVGGVVLVIAMLYQHYNKGSTDYQHLASLNSSNSKKTTLSELFNIACKKTRLIFCDVGVLEIHDEFRSMSARSIQGRQDVLLKAGQKLLEIPRNVQRTTIDALRDPQVNSLLRKNPRHASTKNPLHPKAFLAVHMAFDLSRLRKHSKKSSNDFRKLSREEQLQRAYLDYLPTHQDFQRFHPISRLIMDYKDGVKRTSMLPTMSLTDYLVQKYFLSFLSEYDAFCRVSSDFQNDVSLEDWVTSRLLVNTRSFSSEPLTQNDISNEELESYRPFLHDMDDEDQSQMNSSPESFFDVCRDKMMRSCMVPLLDAFDHHAKPNVGWKFVNSHSPVSRSGSFINFAMENVRSGSDLFHSYGSLPNQFIFAQYGFVNPDGSGNRAALLAPYHRLVDEDFETEESQRDDDLQKYLDFQDGYKVCHATNNDDQRLAFEQVKFNALKAMSNILNSWVAIVPPQDSSDEVEIGKALSICRLLATTHRDYAGRATEMLRTVANADHPEYYEIRTSNDEISSGGLEYRTWHVLERLVTEMRLNVIRLLTRFSPTSSQDFDGIINKMDRALEAEFHRKLQSEEIDPSTSEGATMLVLLGEFETLTLLREHAEQNKQIHFANMKWKKDNGYRVNEEDFIVRLEPCKRMMVKG